MTPEPEEARFDAEDLERLRELRTEIDGRLLRAREEDVEWLIPEYEKDARAVGNAVEYLTALSEQPAPTPPEHPPARVDWTLTGVGYQGRPEVAGPDVPVGQTVGLVRVPVIPCPDCHLGDSGCGTCGDFRYVRETTSQPEHPEEARLDGAEAHEVFSALLPHQDPARAFSDVHPGHPLRTGIDKLAEAMDEDHPRFSTPLEPTPAVPPEQARCPTCGSDDPKVRKGDCGYNRPHPFHKKANICPTCRSLHPDWDETGSRDFGQAVRRSKRHPAYRCPDPFHSEPLQGDEIK